MKSILMSIQPKYCELIAIGEKTVEIRKTKPKLKTPFTVFIYETKAYDTIFGKGKPKKVCVSGGYVIGKFVCDRVVPLVLNENEIYYAWRIRNLVIFDKPMELCGFQHLIKYQKNWYRLESLKRPPRTWCYVEELYIRKNFERRER